MQKGYLTIDVKHQMRDSYKILDHMRKERQLCDVTLVVKNIEIPAHRIVLASYSPFFYSTFTNTEEERVELDVNPQLLISVVNYMYTSKLSITEENIKDLLEIAKILLLPSVHEKCCKMLEHVISPNNCLDIKTVASVYGDSTLLTRTFLYIDVHFVDVVASKEFLNLTNTEICQLLSRDTLRIPCEEIIYECLMRWINHDPKTRRKYLRFLMAYVRLPFISKDYLKQHIVNDPLLREDTYYKDLIISTLLEDGAYTAPKIKARQYRRGIDILLAIGGFNTEANNNLEYYDFEKAMCFEIFKIPCKIWLCSSVAVNQKVYVVGGVKDYVTTSAVMIYDIATNTWNDSIDMAVKRGGLGVTVLNNCIYAVGGMDDADVLNSVEKFDLRTQKWTPIAPMFTKRRNAGVTALNSKLYVVGGYDGTMDLDSVECYEVDTDCWKALSSMNERRGGVGVCTLDGKIYAIGGWNGQQCLATVEVYNSEIDCWMEISPMSVARAWASVAVINNQIYVVGGARHLSESLNSIEIYNKQTNSWKILPESMSIARKCHSCVVVVVDRPI